MKTSSDRDSLLQRQPCSKEIYQNKIALTFDDLPAVVYREDQYDLHMSQVIHDLVRTLTHANVPAIGFVNECYLCGGETANINIYDPRKVRLLETWLDAGLCLGNHTFSHISLNKIDSVEDYKKDVIRGETIIKRLAKKRGNNIIYFRHPYLDTGGNWENRNEINSFLASHHYTVAPVTILTHDYKFALAYDLASARNDISAATTIRSHYLKNIISSVEYYKNISLDIFERDISHVLLLHANIINADCIEQIIYEIGCRGYEFVTLEEALRDPVYALDDSYIGPGTGWMERWSSLRGYQPGHATPHVPTYINNLFRDYQNIASP